MSSTTKHFINGIEIRPKNADEIGFKMDWTADPKEAELNVDAIILVTDAKKMVEEHITNGMGFFEGIPYTIQIDGLALEYYIDLTDNPTFADDEIQVTIKRRKASDWFIQQADGLSFELLNKKAPIQNMIDVKYVIIKDNQAELLIMLGLTTFQLGKALIEGALQLQESIADLAEILPPVPGNLGAIVAAVIKVIARAIYVAALIIALINLVNQILQIIFPSIRTFKASYFIELLTQGCAFLGYQFSSTLMNSLSRLTHLPVPLQKDQSIFQQLLGIQTASYTKGYPTAMDSTPSLGSMIRGLEEQFDSEIRIIGNTVYLEEDEFWQSQSGITIKNTLNIQERRENEHRYNMDNAWKRKYISYQYDISDIHTMDNIDRLQCEYSTEPISVMNPDLVTIKGLKEIQIKYSLGIRKNELNYVESIALELAQFADSVINFFGGSSNLAGLIQGRIGVLQISGQYFSMSKMMYTVGGKQPANYLDIVGANSIYQQYHVDKQVREYFKRIYSARIPFSAQNFIDLLNNNYVFDQNGNQLEILTFDWINETREAEITYREDSDEANNIQTILIDG